jgi:hypothetical protein
MLSDTAWRKDIRRSYEQKIENGVLLLAVLFITVAFGMAAVLMPSNSNTVAAATSVGKSATLTTVSYQLDDNTGYNPTANKIVNNSSHPLGCQFADISLEALTDGGSITKGIYNETQAYGIVAGGTDLAGGNIVEIGLKYNYNTISEINGTSWGISTDTATTVYGLNVGEA